MFAKRGSVTLGSAISSQLQVIDPLSNQDPWICSKYFTLVLEYKDSFSIRKLKSRVGGSLSRLMFVKVLESMEIKLKTTQIEHRTGECVLKPLNPLR